MAASRTHVERRTRLNHSLTHTPSSDRRRGCGGYLFPRHAHRHHAHHPLTIRSQAERVCTQHISQSLWWLRRELRRRRNTLDSDSPRFTAPPPPPAPPAAAGPLDAHSRRLGAAQRDERARRPPRPRTVLGRLGHTPYTPPPPVSSHPLIPSGLLTWTAQGPVSRPKHPQRLGASTPGAPSAARAQQGASLTRADPTPRIPLLLLAPHRCSPPLPLIPSSPAPDFPPPTPPRSAPTASAFAIPRPKAGEPRAPPDTPHARPTPAAAALLLLLYHPPARRRRLSTPPPSPHHHRSRPHQGTNVPFIADKTGAARSSDDRKYA